MDASVKIFEQFSREFGNKYISGVDKDRAFWRLVHFDTYYNAWFNTINSVIDAIVLADPDAVDQVELVNNEISVQLTETVRVNYPKDLDQSATDVIDMISRLFGGEVLLGTSGLSLKLPVEMIRRKLDNKVVFEISNCDGVFTTYSRLPGDLETKVEIPVFNPWEQDGRLSDDGEIGFWSLIHEGKHVSLGLQQVGGIQVTSVEEVAVLCYELELMEKVGVRGEHYDWTWELLQPFLSQMRGVNPTLDHNSYDKMEVLAEKITWLPRDYRGLVLRAITRV